MLAQVASFSPGRAGESVPSGQRDASANDANGAEITTEHDVYDASRANPNKEGEEGKRDTGGGGKRQEDGAP